MGLIGFELHMAWLVSCICGSQGRQSCEVISHQLTRAGAGRAHANKSLSSCPRDKQDAQTSIGTLACYH